MHEENVSDSPLTDSQPHPQIDAAMAVANSTALTWQEIDKALSPLIGDGGVAALYQRSLCLTALTYPWLAGPPSGVHEPMDLDALQALLASRRARDAKAASEAMLVSFTDLLTSLVGVSLTERLLRSVRASTSSGLSAHGGSS